MVKKELTREEILHLAKLANITLTDEEVSVYGKQLSEILGYIEQLNQVDTEKITATSHSSGTKNISAEDIVDTTRILDNLDNLKSETIDGKKYFKVAKVL
ncbi:Asp-tRNA(Asn)/Glu-tRNA(Gln) amidotransferase subunit GatC [Candidatus Roizmanbacteria bacterium]|nr:Asp-tRNA(Asn)/Glu-tRNA(Gln) amidotransferase subunit GatC [Candidatus Roizmanbacteria bacterium]